MPEHDLVLRAEQALLGAVLREPHQIEQVSYLPTIAFTHPAYQAVYQYLRDSYQAQDPPHPDQLPESIARNVHIPGIDADRLRSIAAACPDPGHAPIYARMLQEAHVRSTLASFATSIAAENPTDLRLQQYNQILTQTLARQRNVSSDAAREEPALAVTVRAAHVDIDELPADERARREELVLADLLQHQQQIAEVQTWLSPEIFAPGPRRELFETIVTIDGYGEPITELTVEWELSRRRYQPPTETNQPYSTTMPDANPTRPEVAPQYLGRLMTTAVAVGTAVELGSDLLSETLRVDLAKHAAKTLASLDPSQGVTAEHTTTHLASEVVKPLSQAQQHSPASTAPQLLPPNAVSAPEQPKPRM